MVAKGPSWFKLEGFGKFGKGKAFAVFILGESFPFITVDVLNRIADKLGFSADAK